MTVMLLRYIHHHVTCIPSAHIYWDPWYLPDRESPFLRESEAYFLLSTNRIRGKPALLIGLCALVCQPMGVYHKMEIV